MSVLRKITPVRFILGAAVLLVGGAATVGFVMAYFFYVPGVHMSGLLLTEHMILCVCIGVALFVCALGGYLFLGAVSTSRLRAAVAAVLFLMLAAGCALLPPLLMLLAQALWPDVFRGDSGWNFLLAPYVAAPFLLALFVSFSIGFIACRPENEKTKPNEGGARAEINSG